MYGLRPRVSTRQGQHNRDRRRHFYQFSLLANRALDLYLRKTGVPIIVNDVNDGDARQRGKIVVLIVAAWLWLLTPVSPSVVYRVGLGEDSADPKPVGNENKKAQRSMGWTAPPAGAEGLIQSNTYN